MPFTAADLQALVLTLKLATLTTLSLLVIATPVAWWLATSASAWRTTIGALLALPLVLPPTVIGFYLLLLLGPQGAVGQIIERLGMAPLAFTFWGLLMGSIVYSLPFAVQPLQRAFEAMGARPMEVAATLRASPMVAFVTVALPTAKRGFATAGVLCFAHTVGEFGIVLMLGGNIPGETQVISTQIYGHVEAMAYTQAHYLAAAMVMFSFLVLVTLGCLERIGRKDDL